MSLLYPIMLAGLASLAVPFALHMIARHRFPVRDFPAIRLLRVEKRDNIFARRLVDPWQLLLRLLLLILLALAMGRLFSPSAADSVAPRNLVVVIDASASMRTTSAEVGNEDPKSPMDRARAVAKEIIGEIRLPSRCALIVAGDETVVLSPLGPDTASTLAALETVEVGDGRGPGLINAIAKACEMVRGRREVRSQVVVLTDRKVSAFTIRNQQDLDGIAAASRILGDKLEMIVVDVAGSDTENVAILDSYLRGTHAALQDDAHMITRIANLGEKAQKIKLSMTVAGRREPNFRELTLQPNDEVVVDYISRINRPIQGFANLQLIGKDAVADDNLFSVPVTVAAQRHVLMVNGTVEAGEVARSASGANRLDVLGSSSDGSDDFEIMDERIDGARILQFVLNPGREIGTGVGTGIYTTTVTPDALPAQTLTKFMLIILYDVTELDADSIRDLEHYVNEGSSLLIICSATMDPVKFNSSLAAFGADRTSLSPVRIGNDLTLTPPVGLQLGHKRSDTIPEDVTYDPGPWLAPFRDRRHGDLRVIRFRRVRETLAVEAGANVVLVSTADRTSGIEKKDHILAVEAKRGRGRVMVLMFGVELSRGNLAMSKAFPVLTWRLIDYLTGRLQTRSADILVTSTPAALDVSEMQFSFVEQLELAPVDQALKKTGEKEDGADDAAKKPSGPVLLDINEGKTVYVPGQAIGNYWLRKARKPGSGLMHGYARPIAVNPDPQESWLNAISEAELTSLFGPATRVIDSSTRMNLSTQGAEIWRLVIIALIIFYLLEAIGGYVFGILREKKLDEAEEAVT